MSTWQERQAELIRQAYGADAAPWVWVRNGWNPTDRISIYQATIIDTRGLTRNVGVGFGVRGEWRVAVPWAELDPNLLPGVGHPDRERGRTAPGGLGDRRHGPSE